MAPSTQAQLLEYAADAAKEAAVAKQIAADVAGAVERIEPVVTETRIDVASIRVAVEGLTSWQSRINGVVYTVLAGAILSLLMAGCSYLNSLATVAPSPPQMTAAALNATNDARATALAPSATVGPSAAFSPLPTQSSISTSSGLTAAGTAPARPPTLSIAEVSPSGGEPTRTATPCPATSICEAGPLLTPPPVGVIQLERGAYTPFKNQNARACEALSCAVLVLRPGGVSVETAGRIPVRDGSWWVCGVVIVLAGPGGAQTCDHAMLQIGPDGQEWGRYVRE